MSTTVSLSVVNVDEDDSILEENNPMGELFPYNVVVALEATICALQSLKACADTQ